jgi:hypothetical protein
MGRHFMGRHLMGRHLMGRHLMGRHLMGRHIMRQSMNKRDLRRWLWTHKNLLDSALRQLRRIEIEFKLSRA